MFLWHGAPQRQKHSVIEVHVSKGLLLYFTQECVVLSIRQGKKCIFCKKKKSLFCKRIVSINYFLQNCQFHLACFFLRSGQLRIKTMDLKPSLQIRNSHGICFLPRKSSKIKIQPQGNRLFIHKQLYITLFNGF